MSPRLPDHPTFAGRSTEGIEVISESVKASAALRNWFTGYGYCGSETLLRALILDDNTPRHRDGSVEEDRSRNDIVRADARTVAALPLCPQLQSLELSLDNLEYKKNWSRLLLFRERIES